jgi:hypothetical protein
MSFPQPSKAVISRIQSYLLNIPAFYERVCEVMMEMQLYPPFDAEDEMEFSDTRSPSYLFHTIFNFITTKLDELLSLQEFTQESIEVCGHILAYFREKQFKEANQNYKLLRAPTERQIIDRITESALRALSRNELLKENLKKTSYNSATKRAPKYESELALSKKPKLSPSLESDLPTTYAYTQVDEIPEDFYDSLAEEQVQEEVISEQDIRERRIPYIDLDPKLLSKLKPEEPNSTLYLYNLPKNISEPQIYKLIRHAFSDEAEMRLHGRVDLLRGKMKGQGFLHLDNIDRATRLKETLMGFPLLSKPIIIVSFT